VLSFHFALTSHLQVQFEQTFEDIHNQKIFFPDWIAFAKTLNVKRTMHLRTTSRVSISQPSLLPYPERL